MIIVENGKKMNINKFSHLFDNKFVKIKTENVLGKNITIVCYSIADNEFWNLKDADETRGHAFDENGNCIVACLPKFFNVGERGIHFDDIKHKIVYFSNKFDGSMVAPIVIDNSILFKTKKTFFSDVAELANKNIHENLKEFILECDKQGYTPIFEFIHPQKRIVINYGDEIKFILLNIRNKKTWDFLPFQELTNLAKKYNIDHIIPIQKTKEELFDEIENAKIEGYVIHLNDGSFMKIKTRWYLDLHGVLTNYTERRIAELIVQEKIDDLYFMIQDEYEVIEKIRKIEHQVIEHFNNMINIVENIVKNEKDISKKEMALKYKNHPLFSLLMKLFDNKEPDYVNFWIKNYLKSYSDVVITGF